MDSAALGAILNIIELGILEAAKKSNKQRHEVITNAILALNPIILASEPAHPKEWLLGNESIAKAIRELEIKDTLMMGMGLNAISRVLQQTLECLKNWQV